MWTALLVYGDFHDRHVPDSTGCLQKVSCSTASYSDFGRLPSLVCSHEFGLCRPLPGQGHLGYPGHMVRLYPPALSPLTDQPSDSAAKQILLHVDSSRQGPSKFILRDGETQSL